MMDGQLEENQAGYVPNTGAKIKEGSVVGTGHNERKAPRLMVLYACPKCHRTQTLNAYDGVPSCSGVTTHPHGRTFLEGVRLADQ
jgi:hypothetical protein